MTKAQPVNIYQRILAVMAEVEYVAKGNKKVNNQYTFVGHDAVTAKIHPQLVKHGIVIMPNVAAWGQDGNRTWAELEVTAINADNPDETIMVKSFGYGIDPQDKGPGKAVSYAYKYAILKLFALETGDDPERDLIDHQPQQQPDNASAGKGNGQAKPKPKDAPHLVYYDSDGVPHEENPSAAGAKALIAHMRDDVIAGHVDVVANEANQELMRRIRAKGGEWSDAIDQVLAMAAQAPSQAA